MAIYIDGKSELGVIQNTIADTLVDQTVSGLQVSHVSDLTWQVCSGSAYIQATNVCLGALTCTTVTSGDTYIWLNLNGTVASGCSVPVNSLKLADIDTGACSSCQVPSTTMPACAIVNTPTGTISSISVQAAIDELDSEKVAKAGDFMTGSLDMCGNCISNLSDPGSAQDAATRAYVDNCVSCCIASANEFIELTDTPASYSGQCEKYVRVNACETGLEFINHDKSLHDSLGLDHACLSNVTANQHHAQLHDYDSGADHCGTLSWSNVNKTSSSLADLLTRNHNDLCNIGANDHHNQLHDLDSAGDHCGTLSWASVDKTGSSISDLTTVCHCLLSNLENDDHPQYILADGSRAFTCTVAGIDPVASCHLATKNYVDNCAAIATTFLGLSDTPATYDSCAGCFVSVKSTCDGLEFVAHSKDTHDAMGLDHACLSNVTANQHHYQLHGYDSGSDHCGTLSWSNVSKTCSSLSDLTTRNHNDLCSIGENDHHNRLHDLASASDHCGTLAWNCVSAACWATCTRPGSPMDGTSGYNTDYCGFEYYVGTCWLVTSGYWTLATRPTEVLAGSRGYNAELEVFEYLTTLNGWVS